MHDQFSTGVSPPVSEGAETTGTGAGAPSAPVTWEAPARVEVAWSVSVDSELAALGACGGPDLACGPCGNLCGWSPMIQWIWYPGRPVVTPLIVNLSPVAYAGVETSVREQRVRTSMNSITHVSTLQLSSFRPGQPVGASLAISIPPSRLMVGMRCLINISMSESCGIDSSWMEKWSSWGSGSQSRQHISMRLHIDCSPICVSSTRAVAGTLRAPSPARIGSPGASVGIRSPRATACASPASLASFLPPMTPFAAASSRTPRSARSSEWRRRPTRPCCSSAHACRLRRSSRNCLASTHAYKRTPRMPVPRTTSNVASSAGTIPTTAW